MNIFKLIINIMGAIVYWTLIRMVVVLPLLWIFKDYFDEKYWFILSSLVIAFFIIYPAYNSYRKFLDKNKNVIFESLCSSCKQFDESAVLCMKYDKHPTENFIPCEGADWEPK